MTDEISNSDNMIDIRDVIARVEELRENASNDHPDMLQDEIDVENKELTTLESLLNDLAGYGGDHQWEGSWYPVSLIRDSYFVDAMQELVQDIGDLPRDIPSYLAIDWEKTADNLRADYSSVEFEGITYWYR